MTFPGEPHPGFNPADIYHPSTENRFAISQDQYSGDRISFVKTTGKYLIERFSPAVAVTIKGSLSQGKELTAINAPETDVNMGVFLDRDITLNYSDVLLTRLGHEQKADLKKTSEPVTVNEGKYAIFPSSGLTEEELIKIRCTRSIVEQLIRNQGKIFFREKQSPPSEIWPEVSIISEEGSFSIYATLAEYESALAGDSQDLIVNSRRALALPFGNLQVGDLKPYRKAFFNKLLSLGSDMAERKWQVTRNAMRQNEYWRFHDLSKISQKVEMEFPETLRDAIEKYTK